MKSFISLFLVIVLIMGCLTACGISELFPTEPDPTEATTRENPGLTALLTYIRFMELAKNSFAEAAKEYAHYEIEENRILDQQTAERIRTYEIIQCRELSENLWAVEVFFTSDLNIYGGYCEHYVGIVDGEYRVLLATKHIPAELGEGLELEPYKPHGPGVW